MVLEDPFARSLETVEVEAFAGWGAETRWVADITTEDEHHRVVLGPGALVFGSSRSSDVVVADAAVSGRHCELFVERGRVCVRDLGSRNGTFVGGALIRGACSWVEPGSVVVLGRSTLVPMCEPPDDALELERDGSEIDGLIAPSPVMRQMTALIRRLAPLRAPVLIRGETGVGKELVARALHSEGPRRHGPFVALNASTIPAELAETELFGHERGAFTGAVVRRAGAFAEANGGTLFLDEIADLAQAAQPKLLRALDGYDVRRLGASGTSGKADVRIVSASHLPLLDRVKSGLFRKDLFHRLEVFVIEVPPLRQRRGDIVPICRALLSKLKEEHGPLRLTPGAMSLLSAQPWPGNVRELHATLMRAAVCAKPRDKGEIDAMAVRTALGQSIPARAVESPTFARELLERCEGNVSMAARTAGLPRTTFRKLLEQSRK